MNRGSRSLKDCDALEQEKVIEDETSSKNRYPYHGRSNNESSMRKTGGDAVLVTDVGQHQMVACSLLLSLLKTKSNITSWWTWNHGIWTPSMLLVHNLERLSALFIAVVR